MTGKRSNDELLAEAWEATKVGDITKVLENCEEVLKSSPHSFDALFLSGSLLTKKAQAKEGFRRLQAASVLRPDHFATHTNLAALSVNAGEPQAGVYAADRAIQLKPDAADAHANRCAALRALQRDVEAEAAVRQAIALDPRHQAAWRNLADLLQKQERNEEAVIAWRTLTNLNGKLRDAHVALCRCLRILRRLDDAETVAREAVSRWPRDASVRLSLADTLSAKHYHLESEAILRDVLKQVKPNENLLRALAYSRWQQGALAEAEATYIKARELGTNIDAVHLGLSLLYLQTGRLQEGWEEYQHRENLDQLKGLRKVKESSGKPQWDGEDIQGKTLYVVHEQGTGDHIQFIRYLPLLRQRGIEVLYECPQNLWRLVETLEPRPRMFPLGSHPPSFDYFCALLDLPRLMKTTLSSIPAQTPYLKADSALIDLWAKRLAHETRPRIGIAWTGNANHKDDARRSLPAPLLDPLLGDERFAFFNLYYGPRTKELKALRNGQRIADYTPEMGDMMLAAAFVKNMDLVISVDTSFSHLSGALNHPAWVLLAHVPDWRWLTNREDSPWYPSIKLYRQEKPNDWYGVLYRVWRDLGERPWPGRTLGPQNSFAAS